MSLRGKAAIVGIGEVPTKRKIEGATTKGVCAKASIMAIEDARLRKEDIDGLVTYGPENAPYDFAEYMGLRVVHCQGMSQMGASGSMSIVMAAAAIDAGLCNYVLCDFATVMDPAAARLPVPPDMGSEFEAPFGPVAVATGGYGILKNRHMHEFGTTDEQFAKVAVDERFNALANPNSPFQGRPITKDDVLKSRLIGGPLHMLECVMPCSGGGAVIVTSAERAKALPNRPAYLLGAGSGATDHVAIWQNPRIVDTPVKISAPRAFQMAGYAPKDMQFAEFYD